MGVFMYLLARQLQFGHLPSLLAAITMMLNPFAVGLTISAHGSKLVTLSYLPLLFLLAYRLFKNRNLLDFGLLAIVTGTMFLGRHPQIAFYGLLTIGSYMLYEIVLSIKTEPAAVLKKTVVVGIALAIGFAIYSYEFLPTDQYSKYSIRGGSETGVSKGLDYEYATSWSFHPYESMTYIIPSFFGFGNAYSMEYQGQDLGPYLYWGWMPFTDGPVYIGIIPLLLGIIALIYNRDRLAWFLGLFSILVLFLSFGKFFGVIYDLFFNYFPYFNKFRVPVLILYLIPFTFGLLAANGANFLMGIFSRGSEVNIQKLKKRSIMIGGSVLALLLIGFVAKDSVKSMMAGSMFVRADDHLRYNAQTLTVFKDLRFEAFWNYFEWFAVMVAAFFGLIAAFINRKIAATTLAFGCIILLALDLYLIDAHFVHPQPQTPPHQESMADPTIQALKAESDTTVFRVLPLGGLDQASASANTMMYNNIQSVEGYSPAKLKIYQDMRDSCFPRNNMNVYNMLNVKYLVAQQQGQDGSVHTIAQPNPNMLPRAWFVDTAVVSASKAQTFGYLNSPAWNPKSTAILEQALPEKVSSPGASSVSISSYHSRDMEFKTTSAAAGLLVVSEIYYPAGWKAFVDGKETEIYKTNYILRSVIVPAGQHTVEFKFDPPMYQLGYTLSQSGWGIAVIVILWGLSKNPWVRQRIGLGKKAESAEAETPAVAAS
jgi:hypothetical protein